MSNISLKLGTVKWKLNRHLCPHKQFFFFFCIFKCLSCWLLLELWKVFPVLEVWHKQGTLPFFFFKDEENFKIIGGNKKENEKQNQNNFDVIDFTVSVWKGNRKKRRKSLPVCVSWICQVSRLKIFFFCERSWFAIIANFLWNTNFNFQIVLRKVCLVFRKKESLLHMQWNGFWCLKNPMFGQFS